MSCAELFSAHADSEMEEGEIVDEADDLSDISSDEEFLLRQRLQVLESYNKVLERKEAKRTSVDSGIRHRRVNASYDLSDISNKHANDGLSKLTVKISKNQKPIKSLHKQKKSKQNDKEGIKVKEHKRKYHRNKKKIEFFSDSGTSDISDNEYRNKRRRLENAVSLNKLKNDTSTLKDRLTKMLCGSKTENDLEYFQNEKLQNIEKPPNKVNEISANTEDNNLIPCNSLVKLLDPCETIDLCTSENSKNSVISNVTSQDIDTVTAPKEEELVNRAGNSDDDLELLREFALKTKSSKCKKEIPIERPSKNKLGSFSEDEDSDTAELRMICLKSALLKKAIEIKQKQKLQKRFSQSSIVQDEFDIQEPENDVHIDNNTDIESVDMDIGSDVEDKGKIITDCILRHENITNDNGENKVFEDSSIKQDEFEEDEDLLRAKLLTSLSKNLPNLVELNVIDSDLVKPEPENANIVVKTQPTSEEKKFIIQLGESDSDEGEHEATKNLTKMHIKLSEQQEFQQKLDLFLKSTRMEVEKNKLPDVVQQPLTKTPEKFIAKAMNHLPKSEQIEYKNLVKRMAELERMKEARQIAVNNKMLLAKETLKPRNASLEAYKVALAKKIQEKIALSRKRIAEESQKMLKLKTESTKLSQKYKIVATELRNITTAITLNKKQQRMVQNGLVKIRHQHQMLLKSSTVKRFSPNVYTGRSTDKTVPSKLQKENDPSKEEHKNPTILKSLTISVNNDLNSESNAVHPRLSIQVDVSNNKKVVKLPPPKDRIVDFKRSHQKNIDKDDCDKEKGEERKEMRTLDNKKECAENVPSEINDYKSPLDALHCKNWEEDPNGVLCPFEVGGSCRDPDCNYLHPKIPKPE